MRKTMGYFVRGRGDSIVYKLKGGVLWNAVGRGVTVFKSRGNANRAINATIVYARSKGMPWRVGDYVIERLESQ